MEIEYDFPDGSWLSLNALSGNIAMKNALIGRTEDLRASIRLCFILNSDKQCIWTR